MSQTLDIGRVLGAERLLDTLAQEARRQGKTLTPEAMTIFWPSMLTGIVWQVPIGQPLSEEAVRKSIEPILDAFIKDFVQDLPLSGNANAQEADLKGPSLPKPAGMALAKVLIGDVVLEGDDQGVVRLAGTRIKISQIALEHTRLGLTPDRIADAHPHLSLLQIYVALTYYFDHQEAIDAQIDASLGFIDQSRQEAGSSPLAARLQTKRRLPMEHAA